MVYYLLNKDGALPVK